MFQKIALAFTALLALFGLQQINKEPTLGSTNYVQTQYFTLAGSGVSSGATTMVLKSFTNIDGSTLSMSDFGTKGWGTVEPNNGTQEEQVSFTGVTQNANGTATLTGINHVLNKTPYTETSGFTVTHPGGVKFVISNTAGFYNTFANKTNNETVSGTWTFASIPSVTSSSVLPTNAANFATKQYVDNVGAGGFTASNVSNTQGTFALGTSPETVGIKASSTQGAVLGADGRFYQNVSSTRGLANDLNGTYITTTQNLTFTSGALDVNATTTPTAGKIPIGDSSASLDSWTSSNYYQGTQNNSYWNYIIPISSTGTEINGFTINSGSHGSTKLKYPGFLQDPLNNNSPVAFSTQLTGTSSANYLYFSDNKEIRLKLLVSVSTTNIAIGSYFTFGLGSTAATFTANSSSVLTGARFVINVSATGTSAVGVAVGNGSINQNTAFNDINGFNINLYEIAITSTSAKFYVNGTLRQTYSSNLPTSGLETFGFGWDATGSTNFLFNWGMSDVQTSRQI